MAYIIDGIIVGLVITVITVLFTPALISGIDLSDPEHPVIQGSFWATVGVLTLIVFLVGLLYFPYFWTRSGQTLGMRPFGIRVVRDVDGGPLSLGTAVMRVVGFFVSGFVFSLGYIWVFLDKRRRGWFDLISGTVVIRDPVRR